MSSSSLQFGTVEIGSSSTLWDTIYNPTNASVTITGATSTNGDFAVSSPALPVSIGAGSSVRITVTYTPSAAGSGSGTLMLASSDANDPSVAISLSANAVAAGQIAVQPQSLAFGNVNVGSNQSISVTMSNTGGTNVTVSQIASSSAQFAVSGVSLPVTVAAGQTASFTATFTPTQSGSQSGSLSITGTAAGTSNYRHYRRVRSHSSAVSLTVPLSGTGMAPGQLGASPASLNFGNITTGTTQTLSETLTNSGSASVTINQAMPSGTGFTMSGLTLPKTLAGGQSVAFSVVFAPQSTGAASGSIAISSTATNGTMSISLAGTGIAPGSLTLSPSSLAFGNVQTGTSQKLSATLKNSGGTSVTISQAIASGTGFSLSGITLPLNLAAGQTATLTVTYAPQSAGNATGAVAIVSNASNPNLSLPLTGTGVSAGTLAASPTSLSFGNVQTGSTQSLPETVTNSGGSTVTISAGTASGGGYTISGVTFPVTLNAGQSASFNVNFAPQSSGSASGTVVLTSNASNPSLSIALTGTGVAPGALSANPATLSFGSVQVGSSNLQSETVSNSGGTSITISQANITGSVFTLSGLTLPLTLTAGQNFTFGVKFAPTSNGSASGSLVLTSNAPVANLTISLSGTGSSPGQLAISPATLTFGTVNVGSTQQITATLSATGSSVDVTAITPSTSEFTISGLSLPATIAAGQSVQFTVTFSPQSGGAASATVSFTSDASNSITEALAGTGQAAQQHSVALNWVASTSTVSGYNVYRSGTSGSGYVKINSSLDVSTSYTDSTVQSGQTYYYVTTAVDSSGNESGFSNQVQAVIP